MKKLIIKKLITTSILNMGFSIESITDIIVSINIIKECKTLIILSETLIGPGKKLKIILATEKPIKDINVKIASDVSELNGIIIANIE